MNHGLYAASHWSVPVVFTGPNGSYTDLSGDDYYCEVRRGTAAVFTFKSTGGGAADGRIVLSYAAGGMLIFNATPTQHAAVTAGDYRFALYRNPAVPVFKAGGRMVVGNNVEDENHMLFSSIDDGAAVVVSPSISGAVGSDRTARDNVMTRGKMLAAPGVL